MTASNGRTIGKVAALVIPVGVFLSLAACVIDDGPTGLEIVQDQWLDTGTGAAACAVPATATSQQRIEGVLDVALPDPSQIHYLFYPLVENLLSPFNGLVSSTTAGGVEEKNNIILKAFHVKLDVTFTAGTSFPWDPGCSGEFDVQTQTSQLAPSGFVSEIVEIIRPCNVAPLFRYLQAQNDAGQAYPEVKVSTTIRAKGRLGSSDIESPPFDFPVKACYGCLQTGYADSKAAQFSFPDVPTCSELTANPYLGDPCNPAQDQLLLCCATSWDGQGKAVAMECPAVPNGTAQ
jgi:hypothetical protein